MPMYGEKKLEEFLGSIDARFPLSPIRGGRRKGVCYLSSIWKDRSQPVRDIISLFIVDSGVPPRLISLSFFAGSPDRKMRAPHGEHVSISSTCVTRRCTFIYVEKFRPIHFKTGGGEIGSEEKCSDKHLPLFPNKRIFLFSVENTLFLGARIKSS